MIWAIRSQQKLRIEERRLIKTTIIKNVLSLFEIFREIAEQSVLHFLLCYLMVLSFESVDEIHLSKFENCKINESY